MINTLVNKQVQLWIEQNQWLMKLKLLITEKVEYTAEIEDTSLKKKNSERDIPEDFCALNTIKKKVKI